MKVNMKSMLTKVSELPAGSLFMTPNTMTIALKSEYRTNDKCDCYIYESGEYFCGGDDMLVFQIKLVNDE